MPLVISSQYVFPFSVLKYTRFVSISPNSLEGPQKELTVLPKLCLQKYEDLYLKNTSIRSYIYPLSIYLLIP